MKSVSTDILIVGAGIIGSSLAYHLSQKTNREILLIDLDLEGKWSSSELNAGGVRATWNHPLNAKLANESIKFFESVSEDVGFRQTGYFWMYGEDQWSGVASTLQPIIKTEGLEIDFLTPAQVREKRAFIDHTSDLGGATFSHKDGLINPNLLKMYYRKKALGFSKNIKVMDRMWIEKIKMQSSNKTTLSAKIFQPSLDEENIKDQLTHFSTRGAQDVEVSCNVLVNCTGAWANRFMVQLGRPCFSHAVRRQVSLFESKGLDLSSYGMFIDPSGVYFHNEAHLVLAGFAVATEPEGYHFEYEGQSFFEEHIWPALYERSSFFKEIKHITGWAGLYEVSADHMPIVGKVPGLKNVFESHSFSGRGVMHSHSCGRILSEIILQDNCNLSSREMMMLSSERFLAQSGHVASVENKII